MSNVRDAVEQFIRLALHERDAVYAAWKADRHDKALSARIEDCHANRGEYRDGGFFPCTGTAKLIDTLTPRNGCGAFDKAFQWACEAVRATPAASSDLAKLEAVHKAHHVLIEAYRKAAENPGGLQPTEDEHAEAVNALALTFGLYMPATANRNVDASNPFVQIASHAATLADMYPVIRDEIIRLSELCETEGGRGMFTDELKLNAKKWDELERNRRMLFALLVKHMPNQAKELREICKSGRWTAHDKSLDLEPSLAELRGIVVDARRLIGTSADPHAQPTQQTQPIGESSIPPGKVSAKDDYANWLRAKDVADITGLSQGDITRKWKDGTLATNGKTGKARRFDPASVTTLEKRLHSEGRVKIVPSPRATTPMLRRLAPNLRNEKK